MSFEKTKAVAQHSEEEVEQEKDLNTAEETAIETGPSEEQTSEVVEETTTNEEEEQSESEPEESIEELKARLEKAERDRDNYKQGLLSKKAKERNIVVQEEHPDVDLNEQVVIEVLEKQQEKNALRNTIDPKHADYIPELVDDLNYQEIITFLPRSMDKSDYNSIIKSLKMATKLWKDEKGIKDVKPAKVNIPAPKTISAKQNVVTKPKKEGRQIVGRNSQGMDTWYSN